MYTLIRAGASAYALETSFHLVQLVAEAYRIGGVSSVLPSIAPFRSFAVAEAAMAASATLALLLDPWWWIVFEVMCAAQVSAFMWAETASELAVLYLVASITPGVTAYSMAAWLALCGVLAMRPGRNPGELCHALTALAHVGARVAAHTGYTKVSLVVAGLGNELTIVALSRRSHGRPPILSAELHMVAHALLVLLVGLRYADAASWHSHMPSTVSVLSPEVRGCYWRCGSRVVVARRLHASTRLVDGTLQLPLAYWEELAFAPTLLGVIVCFVAGLRLPLSVRVEERVDANGAHYLHQSAVVLCGWVLPKPCAACFAPTLRPGGTCPTLTAVMTPTRLTLRRTTHLVLAIALMGWV